MQTVAIYNLKGGVGKTTIAVNFAWAAATLGNRRTLLWDLDGQAASTWVLAPPNCAARSSVTARSVVEGAVPPERSIVPTVIRGLDILPADKSLHDIDEGYTKSARGDRFRRLLSDLSRAYDIIVLDCAPGLGATNTQLMSVASIVILPMLPSALSHRALVEVQEHLVRVGANVPPIFPVFNMVDMRRTVHRQAIERGDGYPAIPAASVIELMGERKAPVALISPRSNAATAFADLWYSMEPHLS